MDSVFAAKLLALSLAQGADEAEVYIKASKNLGIEVKGQEIETLESSMTAGYGVRVIKNKQLGFSYSTDPAQMSSVADAALSVSGYAEPDDNLGFALPLQASGVDIFDRRIASITGDEAIEHVMRIEKAALDADGRIKKIRKAAGDFG